MPQLLLGHEREGALDEVDPRDPLRREGPSRFDGGDAAVLSGDASDWQATISGHPVPNFSDASALLHRDHLTGLHQLATPNQNGAAQWSEVQ